MSIIVSSMVLAVLLLAGLSIADGIRTESDVVRAEQEQTEMLAAAKGGVTAAVEVLRQARRNGWNGAREGWSHGSWFQSQPVGGMQVAVGYREGVYGENLAFGIADENRRVPHDLLTPQVISRLPLLSSEGKRWLNALLDRDQVLPWRLDPGFSLRDQGTLEWLVSEFSCGHVNINTVPEEVLVALGIPASGAHKVVAYRSGPDGQAGTADDRMFRDLSSPNAFRPCGLSSHEAAPLVYLAATGVLDVRSNVFRIRSRGFRPGTTTFCEVEAIVRVDENGAWHLVRQQHSWQ